MSRSTFLRGTQLLILEAAKSGQVCLIPLTTEGSKDSPLGHQNLSPQHLPTLHSVKDTEIWESGFSSESRRKSQKTKQRGWKGQFTMRTQSKRGWLATHDMATCVHCLARLIPHKKDLGHAAEEKGTEVLLQPELSLGVTLVPQALCLQDTKRSAAPTVLNQGVG